MPSYKWYHFFRSNEQISIIKTSRLIHLMYKLLFFGVLIKIFVFIDWYVVYFTYILTDNILLGPVQIAIPCTERCLLRPKEMFGNRKVFGQIPRTELLYKLWRHFTKQIIVFWPWGNSKLRFILITNFPSPNWIKHGVNNSYLKPIILWLQL